MKILMVHPTLGIGGAETQLINLSRFLVSRGHEVGIATLYVDPEVRSKVPERAEVFVSENRFFPRLPSESVAATAGILKQILHLKSIVARVVSDYAVINAHNFPATWVVPGHSVPTLWMCNEPPGVWSNPSPNVAISLVEKLGRPIDEQIVRRRITEIAVIDDLNYRRILSRYGIRPHVVFSGVDYGFFSQGNASRFRSKYGLENRSMICQVGWLTPQKDQLQSIKVVERLRQVFPELTLVLCGEDRGRYGEYLKGYVRQRGLQNRVLFTGRVPFGDVADLYNASTVVLFPTKEQTWGLSPLEGACAGALPIVSQLAGVADFIRSKQIGLVTNDFEGAVTRALRNEGERSSIVDRAKTIIRNELSWEAYGSRMETLLRECSMEKARTRHSRLQDFRKSQGSVPL